MIFLLKEGTPLLPLQSSPMGSSEFSAKGMIPTPAGGFTGNELGEGRQRYLGGGQEEEEEQQQKITSQAGEGSESWEIYQDASNNLPISLRIQRSRKSLAIRCHRLESSGGLWR